MSELKADIPWLSRSAKTGCEQVQHGSAHSIKTTLPTFRPSECSSLRMPFLAAKVAVLFNPDEPYERRSGQGIE